MIITPSIFILGILTIWGAWYLISYGVDFRRKLICFIVGHKIRRKHVTKDIGMLRIYSHSIYCERCDKLFYHISHNSEIFDNPPVIDCRSKV